MPRKKRKREHMVLIPKSGNEPLIEVHMREKPKVLDVYAKSAERAAEKTGVDLKIVRASGKSMVSMSGISEEDWNRIFGKKKRRKKKKE